MGLKAHGSGQPTARPAILTGLGRDWASRASAGLKPMGPSRAQSGPRAPGLLEMPNTKVPYK